MILLVVSGASRGFGQAVAAAFVKSSTTPIVAILTARSEQGLLETKDLMLTAASSTNTNSANISIHPVDLGDLDKLERNLEELIEAAKPFAQYERIVIVNNAGSLGHLGKATDMTSLQDFSQIINLNVTSSLWFTTRWARELSRNENVTIVNISSLCAVQAFPTMSTYCAGKAARDMFHESLAKEHPLLKILNYAPGAMDTDMTVALREEEKLEDGIRDFFIGAHAKGELIDPKASAAKLVKLVLSGDYESGKHVDYWDVPDPINSD